MVGYSNQPLGSQRAYAIFCAEISDWSGYEYP